jgi:hypothetical protein
MNLQCISHCQGAYVICLQAPSYVASCGFSAFHKSLVTISGKYLRFVTKVEQKYQAHKLVVTQLLEGLLQRSQELDPNPIEPLSSSPQLYRLCYRGSTQIRG